MSRPGTIGTSASMRWRSTRSRRRCCSSPRPPNTDSRRCTTCFTCAASFPMRRPGEPSFHLWTIAPKRPYGQLTNSSSRTSSRRHDSTFAIFPLAVREVGELLQAAVVRDRFRRKLNYRAPGGAIVDVDRGGTPFPQARNKVHQLHEVPPAMPGFQGIGRPSLPQRMIEFLLIFCERFPVVFGGTSFQPDL